jgi:hypothetical protein
LLTRTTNYSLQITNFETEVPPASFDSALNFFVDTGDPTLGGNSFIDYIVVYHLLPDNYTADPF